MMKFLSISLAFIVLFACGDDEKAVEVVKLTTFKDKLSYVLGAEHSKMVTQSGDPNLDLLDFNAIIEGFKKGVKNPNHSKFMVENNPNHVKVSIEGVIYDSIVGASKELNISKYTLKNRLNSKSKKFKNWYRL